jgi:hypothetical protein
MRQDLMPLNYYIHTGVLLSVYLITVTFGSAELKSPYLSPVRPMSGKTAIRRLIGVK